MRETAIATRITRPSGGMRDLFNLLDIALFNGQYYGHFLVGYLNYGQSINMLRGIVYEMAKQIRGL